MMRTRRGVVVVLSVSLLVGIDSLRAAQAPSTAADETNAKIWVGRYQEFEEYLRTAECVGSELLTWMAPGAARCILPPGGPAARMHWRPLAEGPNRGFWENYKAEIAAYELDKLLKLEMVPPTVERELKGTKGFVTLWVEKLAAWKYPDPPPEPMRADWAKQVARMMMFDDLIGNADRNVANTLRDARWNLILIDHSRAFRSRNVQRPLRSTQIDAVFWSRVQALTRDQLKTRLGPWLNDAEITGILERRERMKAEIDRLIAEKGEAAVMLR